MKFVLSHWLPALALTALAVFVTRAVCPGCVDQRRSNDRCELTDDAPFRIDVTNPAQWRHLVRDAQLAEELAVRHADATFYRWAFPIRTSASGPTQTPDTHADNVRSQEACLAHLTVLITDRHGVTAEQVALARGARVPAFDALVLLSFAPLFIAGASSVSSRMRNLFVADYPPVRVTSRLGSAAAVSMVGVLAFRLWWTMFEGMRVGNPTGHMGFRMASASFWTQEYAATLFVAGMVIVLLSTAFLHPAAATDAI